MAVEGLQAAVPTEVADDECLAQATKLEKVLQRLLVTEQSIFAQEVSRFGLTMPQFVTLSAIATFPDGKERMGRIADVARQCSATMTGIIDRLENMNLVRRQDNPNDRRSVLVELTEAGRAKLEEVRNARQHRVARVLASIEPSVRLHVYEVLAQYTDALETQV